MSGELRPRFLLAVGDVFDGTWARDCRGRYAKPPEQWGRRTIRVVRKGRKYLYLQVDGHTGAEYRQAIDHPERNVGGYLIEVPDIDRYEARVKAAHETLKAHGFDGTSHAFHSRLHDADLFAVADLLRQRHGLDAPAD